MANLIVTVIAIALVAVASLMGAYYGGSAFLKGSAKAAASALVNQGQQIAAGWVLFANDNGGVAPTNINDALVDDNYITENPVAPSSADALTWRLEDAEGAFDSGSNAEMDDLPVYAAIQIGANTVCDEVQRSARGATHTDAFSSGSDSMFDSSRFDCVTGPVADNFTVVYKIQ